MKSDRVPEEDVKIKMSICPACGLTVRCAVLHMMDVSSKRIFANEALKANLTIKEASLFEFREKWADDMCSCNKPQEENLEEDLEEKP